MKQIIAVPDSPMYAPLVANIDSIAAARGFDILRLPEVECADMLLRNHAKLALVSPLGYGSGVGRADYRIVPGPAYINQGLTYTASIYMRENADDLRTCVSPHARDFVPRLGAMILNEKFGLPLAVEPVKPEPVAALLAQYDVVIDWGFDAQQKVVLDISDEWSDLTSLPLPMLMWVCRPDEMPENLAEIVQSFVAADVQPIQIAERTYHGANAEREGSILWQWSDELEPALHKIFEMMFFLQLIPEIPAIKLWGRDPVE